MSRFQTTILHSTPSMETCGPFQKLIENQFTFDVDRQTIPISVGIMLPAISLFTSKPFPQLHCNLIFYSLLVGCGQFKMCSGSIEESPYMTDELWVWLGYWYWRYYWVISGHYSLYATFTTEFNRMDLDGKGCGWTACKLLVLVALDALHSIQSDQL